MSYKYNSGGSCDDKYKITNINYTNYHSHYDEEWG